MRHSVSRTITINYYPFGDLFLCALRVLVAFRFGSLRGQTAKRLIEFPQRHDEPQRLILVGPVGRCPQNSVNSKPSVPYVWEELSSDLGNQ